ncbi:MAG: histidine kinase [Bryobacteraceae bacterium]
MAKQSAGSETEELAALCAKAHATLARAGRSLHDDVGPQLAGSGLLLSLVKSDFPKAAPAVEDVLVALNKAMESVRALSQELNASPVDRLGLRHALTRFSERDPRIEITYTATTTLSREAASAVYEAAAAAIRAAQDAEAKQIRVHVTGTAGISIRITDNGRAAGRKRALAVPLRLAQAAGIAITVTTGKSTIVAVSHALRRSTGR